MSTEIDRVELVWTVFGWRGQAAWSSFELRSLEESSRCGPVGALLIFFWVLCNPVFVSLSRRQSHVYGCPTHSSSGYCPPSLWFPPRCSFIYIFRCYATVPCLLGYGNPSSSCWCWDTTVNSTFFVLESLFVNRTLCTFRHHPPTSKFQQEAHDWSWALVHQTTFPEHVQMFRHTLMVFGVQQCANVCALCHLRAFDDNLWEC